MISFAQAQKIVAGLPSKKKTETVSLTESLGRILASNIVADRDSPPFDRALMDGFAIMKGDLSQEFQIIETIAAGNTPKKKLSIGTCAKIMTGAMLPKNASQVVKVEDTTAHDCIMRFQASDPSDYIVKRGTYLKRKQIILTHSHLIRPQEVALLANVGRSQIKVFQKPRVAVFSTGTEIVDSARASHSAQIRNSNGPMIEALITQQGGLADNFGIVKDDRGLLTKAIGRALSSHHVIVCTGGVSMGDFDFLPEVLRQLRFKILFSRLSIQPGKPMLLAKRGQNIVFALPGNPVSAFVTFILFVAPFLARLGGQSECASFGPARLAESFSRKNASRLLFLPGSFVAPPQDTMKSRNRGVDKTSVKGLSFHDSGQIDVLSQADCLIQIPEGVSTLKEGDVVYARPI